MKGRGLGSGLAVVLWVAFAGIVAAAGFVLLRACGSPLPLAWDFCPTTPAALSAEAARGATLGKEIRQLELELAQKALACVSIPPPPPPPLELPTQAGRLRAQQTALLKPPPPPPPPPPRPVEPPKPPPSFPADRWANKDLSLLNGCWQFGSATTVTRYFQGRPGPSEQCSVTASNVCVDGSGSGRMDFGRQCPSVGASQCSTAIVAVFLNDGTMQWTMPGGACQPRNEVLYGGAYTCIRLGDEMLDCSGHLLRRRP